MIIAKHNDNCKNYEDVGYFIMEAKIAQTMEMAMVMTMAVVIMKDGTVLHGNVLQKSQTDGHMCMSVHNY